MELPLTPSARPRRAPRRSSGAPETGLTVLNGGASLRAGGAYGTPPYGAEALTGRALLRGGDAYPYGTSLEDPYGTEALGRASLRAGGRGAYGTSLLELITGGAYGPEAPTGRASLRTEALSGPLQDEPPCAEALTDELPYTNGTSPSRTGGAYGTSPYGGAYGTSVLTGRRRLRDERPYGPEALTGRASLRAAGAYGASLRTEALSGPLRDEPPCAEALADELPYTNGTSPSRTGGAYGTSPYGGAYGTSVLTGRRRLRDEPLYRPELRASIRDGLTARPRRAPKALRDQPPCLRDQPLLRDDPLYTGRNWLPYRPEALTKRASLRAGGAYGTSHGPAALTGRASLQDGGAGTSLVTGRTRRLLRD